MAKIALISAYYSTHGGGIEIFTHQLASQLVARGHEIRWIATDLKEGLPNDIFTMPISGTNWIETKLSLPLPLWNPLKIDSLKNAIEWCDIVHIQDSLYLGNILATIYSKIKCKPIVLTQHIGAIPYRNIFPRWILKLANYSITRNMIRCADSTVFISKFAMNYFEHSNLQLTSTLIFNGVNTDQYAPAKISKIDLKKNLNLNATNLCILFVGRFVEKKGVQAIRFLAEKYPNIQWIFAGKGPLNPLKWNLANVTVLGHLPQKSLIPYYQAADLLLLPSIGEGFPLVVQEAMSCGLPCLVSEEIRQACPEVSHLMLSAGDRGNNLSNAFAAVIENLEKIPFNRTEIANVSHSTWSLEQCVKQYETIYQKVTDLHCEYDIRGSSKS